MREGIEETGAESLVSKKVGFYQAKADFYLENGDCLSALQTLINGVQDTGTPVLSERETYLREHIVVTNIKYYRRGELLNEGQYDVDGNLRKQISYDRQRRKHSMAQSVCR